MAWSRPGTWCGFSDSTLPSGLVWRAATQLALWATMTIWARMQQPTPQPCPIPGAQVCVGHFRVCPQSPGGRHWMGRGLWETGEAVGCR